MGYRFAPFSTVLLEFLSLHASYDEHTHEQRKVYFELMRVLDDRCPPKDDE